MLRTVCKAAPLASAILLSIATASSAELTLPRVSPGATVTQTIGTTDLSVAYSRPGVKGRVIWGELVPYDKPWRTGANEATRFTTGDEITFGGQRLPAGTYALLTVPAKDEWTVVLNSEKDLWGAYQYKPEKDVLHFKTTPGAGEFVERMEFSFDNVTPTTADLVLRWEKLRVTVPIGVDVNVKVLAACRTEVSAAKSDDWRTRTDAARWCLDNDQALPEARTWLDQALSIQKNYSTLGADARWQMKQGKKREAIVTANQAIAAGKASKEKVDTTQLEKLVADWKAAK